MGIHAHTVHSDDEIGSPPAQTPVRVPLAAPRTPRTRKFKPHPGELGNPRAAGGWVARAACRGADREAFFTFDRLGEAQAYCTRCPVRAECAAAGRREVGTWGGLYRAAQTLRREASVEASVEASAGAAS
jgi:hypothetical protein